MRSLIRSAVVEMLNGLADMDDAARTSMYPVLHMMASVGVLNERYKL